MTKIYNWENEINKNELDEVINILNNDGVIIFPTETVYGIGGNIYSSKVINRVYDIKQRPKNKAINIMVKNRDAIKEYAIINNPIEQKIIDNFMPGALTIILEKKKNIGEDFTQNDNTIGIRIPNSLIINSILDKTLYPILASSANISSFKSVVDKKYLQDNFMNKVDAIIFGNELSNTASTIVKVVDNKIVILREGCISEKELLEKIF